MKWMSASSLCVLLTVPCVRAEVIPVYSTDDVLTIALPSGTTAEGAALQFELDGYDIAALAGISEGSLQIPVASLGLSSGEHTLRILIASDNGDLDTIAEHTLDVYERRGVRAAAQGWNVLLSNHYRVAQDPDAAFAGTERGSNSALLQWSGDFDGGTWIAGGALDAVYNSDRSLAADNQLWQLPTLRLEAGRRFESGRVALAVGDDDTLPDNLVLGGFNRRGLRLEGSALNDRFNAQAFTLHANPVTRLDASLAPFDSRGSVAGAYSAIAPFPRHPEALLVSASWLDGDSDLGGVGIFTAEENVDTPLIVGGRAWTLAFDNFALDRALWLHGEHAQSRFDADGKQQGEPARNDEAQRAVVRLSSGGAITLPGFDQWSLGYEHQRVGPQFFSVGNLMLSGDLDLQQIHAALSSHGASLELQSLAQHTDVDDDALRPRVDSDQQRFSASYTPPTADPAAMPWRWLGVPSITTGYEATSNEQREADLLVAGYDLDNRQRTVSAALSLAHTRFSLGVNLDRVTRDDRSQALIVDDFALYTPPPDSRETLVGLSVSWYANDRLIIAPQWQRSRIRELPGGTSESDLWGLQLQATVIPDVLSMQVGWSDAQDNQRIFELPQDRQRLSNSSGSLDITYRMRTPGAQWPGINWYLRGAYGRTALRSSLFAQADSQWQAQLSFELNWQKAP